MLDLIDAYDLAHTMCGSFYNERPKEFETLNGKPETITNKESTFLIYETRLEALLSYKAFIAHKDKSINAALLWREVSWTIGEDPKVNFGEEYIILVDLNFDQIKKGAG